MVDTSNVKSHCHFKIKPREKEVGRLNLIHVQLMVLATWLYVLFLQFFWENCRGCPQNFPVT